jgi:hypothetical protein
VLDILKSPSAKRFLVVVTASMGAVFIIAQYTITLWIDPDGGTERAVASTLSQITAGILSGLATTAFLLFLTRWLFRREESTTSVRVLEPMEAKREHQEALATTHTWRHNGHIGRWVRTEVLPAFRLASGRDGDPGIRTVELVLLDPDNAKLIASFAQHVRLMELDYESADPATKAREEIFATILRCAIAEQHYAGVTVRVHLRTNLPFIRVDVNDRCAFNTITRPHRIAVAYYKNAPNADFYHVSSAAFDQAKAESRYLDLLAQSIPENAELDDMRKLFLALDLAPVPDDFLLAVRQRAASTYNPYGR